MSRRDFGTSSYGVQRTVFYSYRTVPWTCYLAAGFETTFPPPRVTIRRETCRKNAIVIVSFSVSLSLLSEFSSHAYLTHIFIILSSFFWHTRADRSILFCFITIIIKNIIIYIDWKVLCLFSSDPRCLSSSGNHVFNIKNSFGNNSCVMQFQTRFV